MRCHLIPWDLDASFGQGWDTRRRGATELLDFSDDNLLFEKMLADPAIAGPMRERYCRRWVDQRWDLLERRLPSV